jgi:hypothetical protein
MGLTRSGAGPHQRAVPIEWFEVFCGALVALGVVARPDRAFGVNGGTDASGPFPGECDAARVEMRKDIPRMPAIAGVATPFIVRNVAGGPANQILRSGESMPAPPCQRSRPDRTDPGT